MIAFARRALRIFTSLPTSERQIAARWQLPPATTLAYSDVGSTKRMLPAEARDLIRRIENACATVTGMLAASIGDERAYVARATIREYLPEAIIKYFNATANVAEPTTSVFAQTLLADLRVIDRGIADLCLAIETEYERTHTRDTNFYAERFRSL